MASVYLAPTIKIKKGIYMNTKKLTRLALVAALYVALTLALQSLSYGSIQFRLSEILNMLAFYNPAYIPALTLGAFISNIFSSLGPIDMAVGTFHTFISLYAMSKIKKPLLASLMPALLSFIIALQIVIVSPETESFLLAYLSIAISEVILVTLIGLPLFKTLSKNQKFKEEVLYFDQDL